MDDPEGSLRSRKSSLSSTSSTRSGSSERFRASLTQEEEQDDHIEIPATLHSRETYEFIGFDQATADSIWQLLTTRAEDMEDEFFEFVEWHFEGPFNDAFSEADDWRACMTHRGINCRLQDAILLHEFEDVRYTASCNFWLLEAMRAMFQYLEATFSSGTLESMKTSANEPYGPASLCLEDHTMLWHATFKTKCRMYTRTEHEINFGYMRSRQGDFSPSGKCLYWTPQRQLADRFAQWLKHIAPIAEVVIVQVAVPTA